MICLVVFIMNTKDNFENVNNYDGIVFQGNIKLHSFCSHHHLPFY